MSTREKAALTELRAEIPELRVQGQGEDMRPSGALDFVVRSPPNVMHRACHCCWSLMTIGWLVAAGILPCAGETSQGLSSLSGTRLPVSGYGFRESFQQAARWYRQSEWEQASQAFAQSARQAATLRQRWLALFYEAECLVQRSDYREAHARYDALLGENSNAALLPQTQFRQAQFRWGETAWLAGRMDQAAIALQHYVQQYPSDPLTAKALLTLGDLASSEDHRKQARNQYRRVLEQFPASPHACTAWLRLGQLLLTQEKPDQALAVVQPLTAAVEGPSEAWLLAARAYYQQGRFEQALAKIREFQARFKPDTLTPNPWIPRAHLLAAWALWRLGRLDPMEEELTPLDATTEWQAEVQYLRGMRAYAQQQWGEAARLLCSAALTMKPSGQDAMLFYAGESSRRAGRPAQARKCFDRLLEELPESEWADDAEQALRQLDHASRNTKNALLLEEAQRLQRDCRFDAAISTYHALLHSSQGPPQELPPGDRQSYPVALWRAGCLHERLGQFTEAGPLFEQLLKDYPADPHADAALFGLGEMARRQGKLDQAADYYRQVQTKYPQTAEAREAAYWLALQATDNKDNSTAHRYTDWLLAELASLSPESELSDSEPEVTDGAPAAGDQPAASLPGQHIVRRLVDSVENGLGRETKRRQQQLLAHALYLQIRLAAREGQWEQLLGLANRLLAVAPEGELQTASRFWLAEAEFRLRHEEVARRRFRELAPQIMGLQEPWVPMVPLRQAQLAADRQQWNRVLQWTDKLKRDWPDFPLAYEADYLRGRALAGHGEMSAARVAYQRVLDSSRAEGTETATMAQWMIGETYFHQHQYQHAREAYMAVIDKHAQVTWQALAALQAGKCWELEGHWDRAKKLYTTALQHQAEGLPAKQLQARLRWAERHSDSKY